MVSLALLQQSHMEQTVPPVYSHVYHTLPPAFVAKTTLASQALSLSRHAEKKALGLATFWTTEVRPLHIEVNSKCAPTVTSSSRQRQYILARTLRYVSALAPVSYTSLMHHPVRAAAVIVGAGRIALRFHVLIDLTMTNMEERRLHPLRSTANPFKQGCNFDH